MKQLLIGLAIGLSVSAALAFETGPYAEMRDLAETVKTIERILEGNWVHVESPLFEVNVSISKVDCPELWQALEKEKEEKKKELAEMVSKVKAAK